MNSIHDVGGMAGFGSIIREDNEPVFHHDWEKRVFAINLAAMGFIGPVDRLRHAVERLEPSAYLGLSYYEKWMAAVEKLAVELGFADQQEINTGQSKSQSELAHPAADAEFIAGLISSGMPATRDSGRQEPAFKPGDKVRARNMNPTGHTRLPRYIRGHVGVVSMYHEVHGFPDSMAHDQGENPHPLYNVCFSATELWGEDSNKRDSLNIDLWEDYLEPVED